MKLLFTGDSITDCNHLWNGNLGDGYVSMIYEHLKDYGYEIVNKGYNGYRCIDLLRRWEDVYEKTNPDYTTILVGINEVGSAMEGMIEDIESFYSYYSKLIEKTKGKIILMEPFLFSKPAYLLTWQNYFDRIRQSVHQLARDYQLPLIELHESLNKYDVDKITTDGIHLTKIGHEFLAQKWLVQFAKMEGITYGF